MRSVLRWLTVVVIFVHGLIHLLGAVNGFGWADVTALHEPVGAGMATAWLAPGALCIAAAVLLAVRQRTWWLGLVIAAVVSQAVIVTSWSDAKAGTAVNVLMLLAAGYGFAANGPRSFTARYAALSAAALADVPARAGVVTEEDLADLPAPVASYLRRCGAVGRPRVVSFRARIRGRIRGGPDQPWMPFTGEQTNTYGAAPARLFHIEASRGGLPVDVLHTFTSRGATMHARLCSLLPIIDVAGADLDRAETVTLVNDLCVLAPAALIGAPVVWEAVDDRRARGIFTYGAQQIRAELVFDAAGDLVDFISDDRLRASADGKSLIRQRWSTPLTGYRTIDGRRFAGRGEGVWHAFAPEGQFSYLAFVTDDITYNVGDRPRPRQDEHMAAADGAATRVG